MKTLILALTFVMGANIAQASDCGYPSYYLPVAVEICSVDAIRSLIRQGANVNASDSFGSPLIHAVNNKKPNSQMVEMLIHEGANVNAENSLRESVLMNAILSHQPFEIVTLLINAGADVNFENWQRYTPLTTLLDEKNPDPRIAQALLNAGANPNILFGPRDGFNIEGDNALGHVLKNNPDPELLRVLLNGGATAGENPMAYVLQNKLGLSVVDALIQAGQDVNVRDSHGRTPLIEAALYDADLAVINRLLQAGAQVNAASQSGATPLMMAATCSSHVAVIKQLLQNGANVNAADNVGYTPLMYVVIDNNTFDGDAEDCGNKRLFANSDFVTSVVQTLLDSGANKAAKNKRGEKAKKIARQNDLAKNVINLL